MSGRTRGSVSILLVLLLVPMFYLAGIVIDTSKVVASKNIISGAGDLALNSILAQYDNELFNVYGLFGVNEDPEMISEVSNSFSESVNASTSTSGVINTEIESFEVEFIPESSLSNPEVLKDQILEYMKIRAPITVSQDLLTKFSFVTDLISQSMAISEGIDSSGLSQEDRAMYETIFQSLFSVALTKFFEYVEGSEGESPGEGDNYFNEFEGFDMTNFDKIHDFFAVESVAVEQIYQSVLITEYITEMFSCATSGIGGDFETLSGYSMTSEECPMFNSEVEYILWGYDDVSKNINATKSLLFWVRFIMNSIYAFSSPEIDRQTLAVATPIAAVTGVGISIIQNSLKIFASFVESTIDMNLLMSGAAVPIYKDDETWRMSFGNTIDNLINVSTDFVPVENQSVTMTYQEYLKLFISFFSLNETKLNEMLTRVAEVIQINLSSGDDLDTSSETIEKDADFKINECYTLVEVNATVRVHTVVLGRFNSLIESDTTSVEIDYYGILGY